MKTLFPKDFIWGTATSSCQIEGADREDGKVYSVWDVFAKDGKCENHDTPAVACDHYHKYKEDVALLKQLGVKAYRFSISWPRVIIDLKGNVNQKGLQFYSDLVDELLANDITPFVTLYHWDLPQWAENSFGGLTDRKIVDHFRHYSEVVVKALGDRVKNWMTINEPICATNVSYGEGYFAPGKKLDNHTVANTIHHILMCHGVAVKAVREFGGEGARVGIVINPTILYPLFDNEQNNKFIEKVWEMDNGYFFDPIYFGKYPERPFRGLSDFKPTVLDGDMELISQETDFIGINAYFSYVAVVDGCGFEGGLYYVKENERRDGVAMMHEAGETLHAVVKYVYDHYPVKDLYITENGNAWAKDTKEGQLNDPYRINFTKLYLNSLKKAMDEGYKVSGYFHWSFMDNFEWTSGYKWRFGLVYIDENLNRVPKKSFYWYKDTIKNNGFDN